MLTIRVYFITSKVMIFQHFSSFSAIISLELLKNITFIEERLEIKCDWFIKLNTY